MSSTFRFTIGVPQTVQIERDSEKLTREEFFAWVWREFQEAGTRGCSRRDFF